MGKHRPVESRIAELQAQMVSLQLKANKEAVANNPEVAKIDSQISQLNKDALKWKRWQSDADQKIEDFKARVSEWESRRDSASEWMENYKAELKDLKNRRDEVATQALEEMEANAEG